MKWEDEESKFDIPGTIVAIRKWYPFDGNNLISNDGQFIAMRQMGIKNKSYLTYHIRNMKLLLTKGPLPLELTVPQLLTI